MKKKVAPTELSGARQRTLEDDAAELEERRLWLRAGAPGPGTSVYVTACTPPKPRQRHLHVAALLREAELGAGLLRDVLADRARNPNDQEYSVEGVEPDERAARHFATAPLVRLAALFGLVHDTNEARERLRQKLERVDAVDAEDLVRHTLVACGVDANAAGKWIEHAIRSDVQAPALHEAVIGEAILRKSRNSP